MRLPVSISAVESTVKLPPSSIFLAAPKKRLGPVSAVGSRPPDKVFPEDSIVLLYARARRVMESIKITTSCPTSTRRFALFITSSAALI